MNVFTRTGLLPSALISQKPCYYYKSQKKDLEFENIVIPAPFGLRPFTEYYNPYYPRNCSILCNHPINRDVNIKEHGQFHAFENKGIFDGTSTGVDDDFDNIIVPEDLFRRYTDTDSRPQTPISRQRTGCRRCLTPDPLNDRLQKSRIVLDLRRSLSQDTIIHNRMTKYPDTIVNGKLDLLNTKRIHPLSVLSFSTKDARVEKLKQCIRYKKRHKKTETKITSIDDEQKNVINTLSTSIIKAGALKSLKKENDKTTDDRKISKRSDKPKNKKSRNKKPRKNTRNKCKTLTDAGETLVSSCNAEKPICLADINDQKNESTSTSIACDESYHDNAYLTTELIKDIKRELDLEVLDNELDIRRHQMLKEVMRYTIPGRKSSVANEQIRELKEEMNLFQDTFNMDELLKLPRTFTRRNARFELPINRVAFVGMKPLQYLTCYTYVTSDRKLMYNKIFNYYLEDKYTTTSRMICSKVLKDALSKIIGHNFTDEELAEFFSLIEHSSITHVDFRAWCGIAALSERLLGPLFATCYPSKFNDPPYELEMVDFESLSHRIYGLTLDHHLTTVLNNIRDV